MFFSGKQEVLRFQRALLRWFHHRRRDLPWRRTREPYRIWLAEIMLQQTRVAAVVPYYGRFLRRFPSARALAQARPEQVLKLWAGLGYYRRARNLQRAVKEIAARHAGRFPRELEAAMRLPGIGRYTAAAVLSIAYDLPYAALDGNVARVLARLGGLRGELRAPRRWKQLQGAAQELLAPESPGNWNQAMMELGAIVCKPRAPRCGACPAARWCQAYKLGIPEQLPAARRKRAPVKVTLAAAVLLDRRGRTLLVRHANADSRSGAAALFSRMWQFPAVQVARHAQQELAQHLRALLGSSPGQFEPLPATRHSVTFRDLTLAPFFARLKRLPAVTGARTPLLRRLDRLPISNATRKIAVAALRADAATARELMGQDQS